MWPSKKYGIESLSSLPLLSENSIKDIMDVINRHKSYFFDVTSWVPQSCILAPLSITNAIINWNFVSNVKCINLLKLLLLVNLIVILKQKKEKQLTMSKINWLTLKKISRINYASKPKFIKDFS